MVFGGSTVVWWVGGRVSPWRLPVQWPHEPPFDRPRCHDARYVTVYPDLVRPSSDPTRDLIRSIAHVDHRDVAAIRLPVERRSLTFVPARALRRPR